MTNHDIGDLNRQAEAILKQNDRGGYTIPTDGLYPFQWNWDSALVALGLATFDRDRAWQEIETLMGAQWDNGMVPHIVFWRDDEGYFPGSNEWGTNHSPATSGITQPPVVATIVRKLFDLPGQDSKGPADSRLDGLVAGLVNGLDRWHQWFANARDPEKRGLVAIIHPWESGRDNLPDWDKPLSFVDTSQVGDYQRRDTQHIDADQRPKKADYDRYMALVKFGRDSDWDDAIIAKDSPFWVADVGMNAILRRAEHDLIYLADTLGKTDIAQRARARAARLDKGFEDLWSETLKGYVSLDLRRNEPADCLSAGSWLAFYAGEVPAERSATMIPLLEGWIDQVRFAIPSFDPAHGLFDSIRYWRGPAWAIINWMIADGVAEAGHKKLAERIRTDTETLIRTTGFYEYFCPLTGKGGGGDAFSWTAAMWLGWASPTSTKTA